MLTSIEARNVLLLVPSPIVLGVTLLHQGINQQMNQSVSLSKAGMEAHMHCSEMAQAAAAFQVSDDLHIQLPVVADKFEMSTHVCEWQLFKRRKQQWLLVGTLSP